MRCDDIGYLVPTVQDPGLLVRSKLDLETPSLGALGAEAGPYSTPRPL